MIDEGLVYLVADLVCPDLGLVYVVGFLVQLVRDYFVYLLLHEGADVVEHGLVCLRHPSTFWLSTFYYIIVIPPRFKLFYCFYLGAWLVGLDVAGMAWKMKEIVEDFIEMQSIIKPELIIIENGSQIPAEIPPRTALSNPLLQLDIGLQR